MQSSYSQRSFTSPFFVCMCASVCVTMCIFQTPLSPHAVVERVRLTTGPASDSSKLPVDRRLLLRAAGLSGFRTTGSFCCILTETEWVTESARDRGSRIPLPCGCDSEGWLATVPISSRMRLRVTLAQDFVLELLLQVLEITLDLLEGVFGLRSTDGCCCCCCCFGMSRMWISDAFRVVVSISEDSFGMSRTSTALL